MTKSAHIQAFHRKRPSSRTVGGRPDDSCRPLSQQIVALSFLDSSQASSVGGVSAQGDFVTSNQTFLGRAWHAETQSTVHSAPSQSSDATLRSSRDLEQGICEYVEKKLPVVDALGVSISLPVRLIGWMLRREGLFRHYKRRFCVFEADVSTLYIFANDDTSNHGRLLRQMVLTEVQLTSRHARSFYLQGYTQKRELHKKQSDTMAKRASSLSKKAMPGDMQRFYLPEEEILRAVSDRATSVWAQCFLNHMRLHRVRRQHQQARANNSATIPDEEDEDDDDELDSDDEDMNPDFTFIERGNEAELSQAADIYSFGILLSEIDTNELPFHDRMKTADGDSVNEDVLLHHVVADGWKPSFRVFCPEFIRSLAQECLQADPSKRPNSLDVAYRLRKAANKAASEWKRLPVPPALAAISE
ncbi:TPA: hypothetical protein N0F65_002474 [Lagenidium giganteum]|uniref:Serine-threonine/tyrosine-protein kinase catalytic domain-containing protein n=1 Tax=Lagenidium giganteum TaxID=4803 RepID=A0AAV2YX12_9STRA|nr:TPA: hypothetical protein N0F65_002474 [Lagenidium giganteum]